MTRTTYCTKCKRSVELIQGKYLKLANNKLVIEGYCPKCKNSLWKSKVMPRSGKKPRVKSSR